MCRGTILLSTVVWTVRTKKNAGSGRRVFYYTNTTIHAWRGLPPRSRKWHWRVLWERVVTVLALKRSDQLGEISGRCPSALRLARHIERSVCCRFERQALYRQLRHVRSGDGALGALENGIVYINEQLPLAALLVLESTRVDDGVLQSGGYQVLLRLALPQQNVCASHRVEEVVDLGASHGAHENHLLDACRLGCIDLVLGTKPVHFLRGGPLREGELRALRRAAGDLCKDDRDEGEVLNLGHGARQQHKRIVTARLLLNGGGECSSIGDVSEDEVFICGTRCALLGLAHRALAPHQSLGYELILSRQELFEDDGASPASGAHHEYLHRVRCGRNCQLSTHSAFSELQATC
mmetsp:Transcript_19773/g.43228  ORF Transcript_19773/g.43228 Transcript_19773/m.43228 type:complete len:351 (+) Transcript_19773:117-1169(+)